MKFFAKLVLGFLLTIGICGPASASTLYYNFELDVTDLVSGTNDLGLTDDSLIDVHLQLDNSVSGSGTDSDYTTHEPEDYTTLPLTVDDYVLEVTINGTTYDETMDIGYPDTGLGLGNWPYITVNLPSWDFHRLELWTADFKLYLDEDEGMILAALDNSWVVEGETVGSLSPVPEPGTLALFGIGLLSFVGIGRKRL